jgi:hypothetical protein
MQKMQKKKKKNILYSSYKKVKLFLVDFFARQQTCKLFILLLEIALVKRIRQIVGYLKNVFCIVNKRREK